MDRTACEAVRPAAGVAEELIDVIVIRTPARTVGRRTVIAVGVPALCLPGTERQVLLVNIFRHQLQQRTSQISGGGTPTNRGPPTSIHTRLTALFQDYPGEPVPET